MKWIIIQFFSWSRFCLLKSCLEENGEEVYGLQSFCTKSEREKLKFLALGEFLHLSYFSQQYFPPFTLWGKKGFIQLKNEKERGRWRKKVLHQKFGPMRIIDKGRHFFLDARCFAGAKHSFFILLYERYLWNRHFGVTVLTWKNGVGTLLQFLSLK